MLSLCFLIGFKYTGRWLDACVMCEATPARPFFPRALRTPRPDRDRRRAGGLRHVWNCLSSSRVTLPCRVRSTCFREVREFPASRLGQRDTSPARRCRFRPLLQPSTGPGELARSVCLRLAFGEPNIRSSRPVFNICPQRAAALLPATPVRAALVAPQGPPWPPGRFSCPHRSLRPE